MASLWENDQVQFMRLLSEIRATVQFTPEQITTLCESMDLEPERLDEVLERAELAWQKHLGNIPPTTTLEQFLHPG